MAKKSSPRVADFIRDVIKDAETPDASGPVRWVLGSEMAIREDLSERDQLFVPAWDPNYIPGDTRAEDGTVTQNDLVERGISLGIALRKPVLVVGPTGSGKNAAIAAVAAGLNQPLRRINLHGDVRASDVLGTQRLTTDPITGASITSFSYGVLPDAMRSGHWLLLDEFDACPAPIAFTLQAVLEGQPLVLAANGGEVIQAHPHFRILATANTLGRGDDSGLYAGTNTLNEATLDRFLVVEVTYMPKDREVRVVVARSKIEEGLAIKMVEIAHRLRAGFGRDCDSTFSTRHLVCWAEVATCLGGSKPEPDQLALAYELAVGNRLNGPDRALFAGTVQREMGLMVKGRDGDGR